MILREPTRRITVEDWVALDEDDEGEFVDGVIVEEEMPDYIHELVVAWLLAQLQPWAAKHGAWVAGSDAKFVLGERRGRKPDATLYLRGRRPPLRGGIRLPPDVAVEILSVGMANIRRDRITKMDEYAAFGVRWYWLIDPAARTLEIWTLQENGRYAHECGIGDGKLDPVPGLDGLSLDVDALWSWCAQDLEASPEGG